MIINFKAINVKDYWILQMSANGLIFICYKSITHICKFDEKEFFQLMERCNGNIQELAVLGTVCTFINKEDSEAAIEAIWSIILANKLVGSD